MTAVSILCTGKLTMTMVKNINMYKSNAHCITKQYNTDNM